MRFSVYITAQAIAEFLTDTEGVSTAIEQLRAHHIDRVFLEARRAGVSTPEERLAALRDQFSSAGFLTAGGTMPMGRGREYGKQAEGIEVRNDFLCYSSPETARIFEDEVRKLARIFDTIILDDAFLTPCRCQDCTHMRASRGNPDWGAFRRELLARFSEEHVIVPAKQENPDVRVIIKFPQYYDRYGDFGYDPVEQTRLFDAVWAGTETRDPNTLDYGFVPPYEAISHVSFLRSLAGEKLQGAWFDSLDCTPGLFRDQAILTTLSGVPEITIYCYSPALFASDSAMTRCLREDHQRLRELSTIAGAGRREPLPELVWYRPPHADGREDLSIPDFWGMWAVPVRVSTRRPDGARAVLLSAHALSDPHPEELIEELENSSSRLIATTGFLQGLENYPAVRERFGVTALQPTRVPIETLRVDGNELPLESPITLPFDMAAKPGLPAILAATAQVCGQGFVVPLWLEADGTHAVLNLRTFGRQDYAVCEPLNVPILTGYTTLHPAAVSRIRTWCLEPFGMDLDAPNWTCLVPLNEDKLAIVRPHASAATVRLKRGNTEQIAAIPSHDFTVL